MIYHIKKIDAVYSSRDEERNWALGYVEKKYIKRTVVDVYTETKEQVTFNMARFNEIYKKLSKHKVYSSFKIPKKTGGFRQIDAPDDETKENLRELTDLIKHYVPLVHPKAYAYVEKKWCKNMIEYHQKNNSRWFLKLDFKDFFGSWDKSAITYYLSFVHPFNQNPKLCKMIAEMAVLPDEDKLPQGSPLSPYLTNILMISIDYEFNRICNIHQLIYTRYADDILISSKLDFEYKPFVEFLTHMLPINLHFSDKKTRYGSRAGQNWNLGMMLNKDNNITVGYRNNKKLKAMLHNFFQNKVTSYDELTKLRGIIEHYRQINPETTQNMIQKYEEKHDKSFTKKYKTLLKRAIETH